MKTVEMEDATQTLAECAGGIEGEVLIVTESPVAVLLPLVSADLETISLSSNRRFLELIAHSRSRLAVEGAVSPEGARHQLGI